MAEQGSGMLFSGFSECNSKYILTNESDKLNSGFSGCTSKWLAALKTYLRVTQTTCLELKPKQVGVKEAEAIYKFLADSQVTKLNIRCGNILSTGIEDLLQFLINSKIKTLSFCWCMISKKELLLLMEALKNTHVTELHIQHKDCKLHHYLLNDSISRCKFNPDEKKEFISHLLASHLSRFDFPMRLAPFVDDCSSLLSVMLNTSVTNLNLSDTTFSTGVLSSLFSSLRRSAITDLNLSNTRISEDDLKQLSHNLRDSSVVNLNLASNGMNDAGLDILTVGLVHSKISSLDISQNSVTGSSCFGLCLKDSQISSLNLSHNDIQSVKLLSFPHFLRYSSIARLDMSYCGLRGKLGQEVIKCLRFSKVTHLNLSWNDLESSSLSELALVLKDADLSNVSFPFNGLPPEGVVMLGDCLKHSSLRAITVNNRKYSDFFALEARVLSLFLEKTKDTSIETVDLNDNGLGAEGVKTIGASLVNTTFTHLNLGRTSIQNGLVSLAPQLRFTAITHLNLYNNRLVDAGVEILANCLKDTKIIQLDLSHNFITDHGAEDLANSLEVSNLIHLNLSSNQIGNEGLEILAKHAEGTFITVLDVTHNPGNRNLLFDRIVLENQTSVHRFVSFFKQITPESNDNSFCFSNIHDKDVEIFLEEYLLFHKTVLEQSSAVSVLVVEDSLSLSMEQSATLLKEEFPRQFTAFIANQIEASPAQHVSFLKRAEELELTKIVELLLLNRPALMIDKNIGIMDPYVYLLLHKYKQPLYSSVEPEGKSKIIEYFTEHSDLNGAFDVINILNSKRKKDT